MSNPASIVTLVADRLSEPQRSRCLASCVAPLLEVALTEAQTNWPELGVVAGDVAEVVVTRWPVDDEALDEAIGALHLADLVLAARCARGEAAALTAFERRVGGEQRAALSSLRLPSGLADEARQEVARKLFVSELGAPPKIVEYSGRAALSTWVRTASVRTAISLLRRERATPAEEDDVLAMPATSDDPELAAMKTRARSEFKAAFHEALASLTPRERNLLRYQILDGLGIDQIGELYGVHRATAARWLVTARELLGKRLRRALHARLQITPSEVASLERLVESQLDLSLHRVLAPETERDPSAP